MKIPPKQPSQMLAKKSLGQNFLNTPEVIADIISAAQIKPADTVLEVGPGEGVLTQALLEAGTSVIAIEKDDRLIPKLSARFANEITAGKLTLVHDDALEFSISNFQIPLKSQFSNFKIVANIPYYITGKFLRKIFGEEKTPELVVLLLQKEVAERIVAKDGKESLLSISVKAYGTPSIVRYVPRENFEPVPDVDSAVLLIEKISRDFFEIHDSRFTIHEAQERFFELVKKGFAGKRKQIGKKLGLPGDIRRAEELSLADWQKLHLQLV